MGGRSPTDCRRPPVAAAPKRVPTVLDSDHQFDNGSGITLTTLSSTQIANLVTLAKVWGFVKYHHPAVTSGQHHWDYDLFRVMPDVLAAPDQTTALNAISTWIANLEPVSSCTACATIDTQRLVAEPGPGVADRCLASRRRFEPDSTEYLRQPLTCDEPVFRFPCQRSGQPLLRRRTHLPKPEHS